MHERGRGLWRGVDGPALDHVIRDIFNQHQDPTLAVGSVVAPPARPRSSRTVCALAVFTRPPNQPPRLGRPPRRRPTDAACTTPEAPTALPSPVSRCFNRPA
ncbi:MAG: hypothetical protein M3Q03_00080 [Chloroflexota bacterium]|nr:hypothetical protein [Chloroflexota bacterium]